MKFYFEDILNFISEEPTKDDLSKKLFQLGHEHEINGSVFDMEITPNRGDCLSLLGLSRDLYNFYDIKDPFHSYDREIEVLDINFKNLSTDVCPKISFLEIEIDEHASSYKPYLENYFSKLGNKKTNFFSDISNYISYERGQPTHCFDRKSLGDDLTFSNETCEQRFKTLLGNEIMLEGKNSIFKSGNEIVSLAGVMGGEPTACSTETKKVLVECAYFTPESIIGKTIKYNLKSDAAHKFERGVDITSQENILRRFISVVEDHATIKSLKMKIFTYHEFQEKILPLKTKKINEILGTDLTEQAYTDILVKLGFEINKQIVVPPYRHDISSQNDLSEEIARIIGYDTIESIPLKLSSRNKSDQNKISKMEDFLTKNGFSEVINFPFTANKDKKSILIDNSLDSNRKNLRTSLKDSLIENLLFNERRQKDSIKLFEISDVYLKAKDIHYQKRLGIIISGRRGHNHRDFSKKLDRNYLNEILNFKNDTPFFDIEEISREKLKTKKKDKIFYTEILLDDVPEKLFSDSESKKLSVNFIKYEPISEFPSSIRDFSLSIKSSQSYKKVISLINDFKDEHLSDYYIFDFYLNEKLGEIKVGIRLIFQSNIKTLSDEDIQKSVNKILNPVLGLDGVLIPGFELK